MSDLAKMSNQERINLLGVEEASKYHGPYERTTELEYIPALTPAGAKWHQARSAMREKGINVKFNIPREFVIPTQSFKKNKPEKKEVPTVKFDKSKLKKRKKCTS